MLGRLGKLLDAYLEQQKLFSLTVNLTRGCNLNCRHCYLSSRSRQGELDAERLIEVLAEVRALDTWYLLLSGGEPLLHPDWRRVLRAAKDLGYFVTLFSHAGIIDDDSARFIRSCGVYDVSISVYSADPEVHDRVTRRSGSLAATQRGAFALVKAGVHLTVRTLLMDGVSQDDANAVKVWLGSLGPESAIRHIVNYQVMPQDNGDAAICDLNLSSEQLSQVAPPLDDAGAVAVDMQRRMASPLCGAATTALHLEADGTVRPCMVMGEILGDVRKESFAEIWNRLQQRRRQQGDVTLAHFDACHSCAYVDGCRPCQGLAEKEHGWDRRYAPPTLTCCSVYAGARAAAREPDRVLLPAGLSSCER